MKKALLILPFLLTCLHPVFSQNHDSLMVRKIFTYCLEQGKGYEWLEHLCTKIPPRLSGSDGADKAVKWARQVMEEQNNGRVYLQDVMVPHWVRNDKENLTLISKGKRTPLRICSLGGSVPTPSSGLRGKVIEVKSFEELNELGEEKVRGKIVFYNAELLKHHYHTFHSYGECGKYRWAGAINAAKMGAIASVNRSLTLALDDYPHTGSMGYEEGAPKLPACAISTLGADKLSAALNNDPDLELELVMNCETLSDKPSHNVIAEIKGSEFPDEIIVVGGHLDAWDNGQGAHDDGAGCVQSMELLRIFRDLNIKPKRTIRVVLFMNEENGVRGGKKYAEEAKAKNENHIAAIESDLGGFTPAGFFSKCEIPERLTTLDPFKHLFEPYGIFQWDQVGGGVDIDPLKPTGTLLIGLQPDSQRYFDYHHTEIDTFDKIHKRELHLGAAAVASLAYLLSEYGVVK
jgi:hypothetical protein